MRFFIIIFLFLLGEFYCFRVIGQFLKRTHTYTRVKHIVFYLLTLTVSLLLLAIPSFVSHYNAHDFWRPAFGVGMGLFVGKLFAILFYFLNDLIFIVKKIWIPRNKVLHSRTPQTQGPHLSRLAFLNWLGVGMTGIFAILFAKGTYNRYRYQIIRHQVPIPRLPDALKGFKIVQISDIHSGSFDDPQAVARGIEMINDLKPDIIFFTGDLVNSQTQEVYPFVPILSQLKAPHGVFSILGNHDYGDYHAWPSEEAKLKNLQAMHQVHANLGWTLLLDQNQTIIHHNELISIIGVENWSIKAHFPKYGNLEKAYAGVAKQAAVKILLSHDPSHWKAEVTQSYPDINLTLSGHTHGMQFGVDIPGFRWSPVAMLYDEWAGLYNFNSQYLNVNRGFGFIGYPGRVGILPEITVLELV